MADRRLRSSQFACRTRDTSFAHHDVEHAQQIQVEVIEAHEIADEWFVMNGLS